MYKKLSVYYIPENSKLKQNVGDVMGGGNLKLHLKI